MYKASGNLSNLKFSLEESYKIFVDWTASQKLEIARDKLTVMLFNRRRIPTNNFMITLDGRHIYPSKIIQHLGFAFDPT